MRKLRKLIGALLLAATALGFQACQDDVNAPGLMIPKATLEPNTTIAKLKADYWDNANNYIDTIKLTDNGNQHVVISGRVISSDASGNIYKSLVIQDATGALAMSINANSLYNQYRVGQEVVIDVTDMYIGKYSTLQQLGFPDFDPGYGWQATFMPLAFFQEHAQLNGLPQPEKVDTLTITIPELGNDVASLQKYQSQLIRLNNVHFEEGGEVSFCTAHKENTNRTLVDENGNKIIVRTSGYANFWSTTVPAESGDVVGILSSYLQSGTITWQLALRSTSDLMNFGSPTLPVGTEANPYDVLAAVEANKASETVSGWFTGYIVGAPKAGVTEITSPSDIQWTADEEGGMFLVSNAIIVGQTPDAKTLDDVMLVTFDFDTPFQVNGNLFDHPELIGRQIWVKGYNTTSMNITALGGNTGGATEFRIEGVTVEGGGSTGGDIADGNGTEASPYSAAQVVAKGNTYTENGVWVTGYIVGWIDSSSQNYADANNTYFTTPATIATNVLLAADPNETDLSKCMAVNLPTTSGIRAAVNLVDNPSNLHRQVWLQGNIIKYFTLPGLKEVTAYKFDTTQGGGTETPGEAVTSLDENFASGAKPAGWSVVNVEGNKDWFFSSYSGSTFAACSAYNGTPGSTGFESWLITPAINITAATSKVLSFESMVGYSGEGTLEAYVLTTADPKTATMTKLNATIPQPTGSWGEFTKSGDLSLANYNGTIYIGFRYKALSATGYTTYRVTNVKLGEGSGTGGGNQGGGEENPPAGSNTADLNTLATSSSYGTFTTTDGWVAVNCAVQSGGDTDSNPKFTCIGSADTRAVCLNGKTTTPGSLTSPTLTGGITSLTFNYGLMFAEGNLHPQFTVNIKQNGSIVASSTVTMEDNTKFAVQTFSMTCAVTGNFVIEIVNDCVGGQTSNKERVSIWNISWNN